MTVTNNVTRISYEQWRQEHTRMAPGELKGLQWRDGDWLEGTFYAQAGVEFATPTHAVYFRCAISEVVMRCTNEQMVTCNDRCPYDADTLLRRLFTETMVTVPQ